VVQELISECQCIQYRCSLFYQCGCTNSFFGLNYIGFEESFNMNQSSEIVSYSSGSHEIHFKGQSVDFTGTATHNFAQNLIYHLKVQ
jgi:hypothetical protein